MFKGWIDSDPMCGSSPINNNLLINVLREDPFSFFPS